MKTYKALSLLLSYPEPEWLAELDEVEGALTAEVERNEDAAGVLAPLFAMLRSEGIITLQESYVATFDRNPRHSLHLFEHIHGESRERGPAMLDLQSEYARCGLTVRAGELPDYVPLFLEYLSLISEQEAAAQLADAVHVLAHIGRKLGTNTSPYAHVFNVLERLSPVAAEPLLEPPVRDMDAMLANEGPLADGSEPLLVPRAQVAYVDPPRSRRRPAGAH